MAEPKLDEAYDLSSSDDEPPKKSKKSGEETGSSSDSVAKSPKKHSSNSSPSLSPTESPALKSDTEEQIQQVSLDASPSALPKKKRKKRKQAHPMEEGIISDPDIDEGGKSPTDTENSRIYPVSDGEASHTKLHRLLGSEVDPVRDGAARTYAPQPPHVKQYKMKKKFGEDVVVEYDTQPPRLVVQPANNIEESIEMSEETAAALGVAVAAGAGGNRKLWQSTDDAGRQRAQARRVQKFFGEKFDLEQVAYTERLRRAPPSPFLSVVLIDMICLLPQRIQ